MSITELERPLCRVSRPHLPMRRPPASKRAERRLQSVAHLIVDDGCDVRLRGGHYADVVRVALLEWLPLTRGDLRVYECRPHGDPPVDALAALVRPPTIWTLREALLAAERVGPEGAPGRALHGAFCEYAVTQLGDAHLMWLRCIAARFRRQIPAEGLPRASATLANACAAVADDDEACAAVAATALARYASSAFVAERRREAAPTMT